MRTMFDERGLGKRCGCPRRLWPQCRHPWWGWYTRQFPLPKEKFRTNLTKWNQRGAVGFGDAREVRKAWVAEIEAGTFNPNGRHHTEDAEQITFAELVHRYRTDDVGGLGAKQLSNGRWIRPGHERDSKESLLPMTGVLERVWAHYRISVMAKALPAEAEGYLKEVKQAQSKTPYAWKSQTTWNRYRERASAIFRYAERQRLIPFGSNPFMVGRVREFTEFEQDVPSRRIPPSKQLELLAACDRLWANSKRFTHLAEIMKDRLKVLFGTSIRSGEMLSIQREHCSFVTEEGAETARLFKADGGSRLMVRISVPPQMTKAGKRTGRGFTRYVATADALGVFRRKMRHFDAQPKAFLFGTFTGARVHSFRRAAANVFKEAGLRFGRGRGQFRIHDARHETISALSQSPELNDAQVKMFTGITSDRTLARYRHLENMDVALLAARVLDQRAKTRAAESMLAAFVKSEWSVEDRAKFIAAAQSMAEATGQSLSTAAELLVQQIEAGRKRQRKRVISGTK
jgi:integrase